MSNWSTYDAWKTRGPDDGDRTGEWLEKTRLHFKLENDDDVTREMMNEFAEWEADMLAYQQTEHAELMRDAR